MKNLDEIIKDLKAINYRINIIFNDSFYNGLEGAKFYSNLLRNIDIFEPGRNHKTLMYGYKNQNVLLWNYRFIKDIYEEIGSKGKFLDMFSKNIFNKYEIDRNKYENVNNYINFLSTYSFGYIYDKYEYYIDPKEIFQINIEYIHNDIYVEKQSHIHYTIEQESAINDIYDILKTESANFVKLKDNKDLDCYSISNQINEIEDYINKKFINDKNKYNIQLLNNDIIKVFDKEIKKSVKFRQELWSALANVYWYKIDNPKIVAHHTWGSAADFIASHSEIGTFLTYYLSSDAGFVSERIEKAMLAFGWDYTIFENWEKLEYYNNLDN